MKTPHFLYYLMVILTFSDGLASDFAVQGGVNAARIPEHTCHTSLRLANCDNQECLRECSKHPHGTGQCKDSSCFCTFYCKNPPL